MMKNKIPEYIYIVNYETNYFTKLVLINLVSFLANTFSNSNSLCFSFNHNLVSFINSKNNEYIKNDNNTINLSHFGFK
jgi:hypothetical protein